MPEETELTHFIVISPDRLPTSRESLPTLEAAFDEMARFCKSYIHQGYYSAVDGRIELIDLPGYLRIETCEPDEEEEDEKDDRDNDRAPGGPDFVD